MPPKPGQQATLDGYLLPFDPDSVTWSYRLNTAAMDTLGGRVVQILSVQITYVTWQGVAGTQEKLFDLYHKVEDIMNKHADTQRPVRLLVPSKNWAFDVYVRTFPQMGFSVETAAFPYQLIMDIDEDFGGLTKTIMTQQLKRLSDKVGYDPRWHGGVTQSQADIDDQRDRNEQNREEQDRAEARQEANDPGPRGRNNILW